MNETNRTISERYLRTDHIRPPGSIPVEMADGQEWLIPKPQIFVTPTDDLVGYEHVAETGDPAFDAVLGVRLKALRDAFEPDSSVSIHAAKLALYRAMIERNYHVPLAVLRTILRLRVDSEGMDPLDLTLFRIAQGLDGPKPGSDGDA